MGSCTERDISTLSYRSELHPRLCVCGVRLYLVHVCFLTKIVHFNTCSEPHCGQIFHIQFSQVELAKTMQLLLDCSHVIFSHAGKAHVRMYHWAIVLHVRMYHWAIVLHAHLHICP